MDNVADSRCFAVWKTMTTVAARPVDPATIPNASRPYSERGSRRLERVKIG